jgi:AcrR family transcriptional regulator
MSDGLRERKKAETRRALSSAALRLARELGPEVVTVEAIAEAAGVSPRTFFNYFASKEDAIVGVAPAEASEILADLVARPEGEPPLVALRAMCASAAERIEALADEMQARHELAQLHPPLAARRSAAFADVERRLAGEIARRTGLDVDRDPYPALVVAAAMGALKVGLSVWQERGRAGRLVDVIDEGFRHIERGLGLPAPATASA